MTTLDECRARVRRYLDDTTAITNAQRWSTSDIDLELKAGIAAAMMIAAGQGGLYTTSQAFTTTAAGTVDLTTLAPLKIARVALSSGDERVEVPPATFAGDFSNLTGARTVVISYVPAPVLPGTGSAPLVFGTSANTLPQMDEYACLYAASRLKITEGDLHTALERARLELMAALQNFGPMSSSWVPMKQRSSRWMGSNPFGAQWVEATPHVMQLVVR